MTKFDPAGRASTESLPPHAAHAPSNVLFLTEGFRALLDLGMLLGSAPILTALPAGDGHPVMVLPGLMGSDSSTLGADGSSAGNQPIRRNNVSGATPSPSAIAFSTSPDGW